MREHRPVGTNLVLCRESGVIFTIHESGANVASNGVGSRGPLKGHWRGPGAEPRWGSRVPGGTYIWKWRTSATKHLRCRGLSVTKRTKIGGLSVKCIKKIRAFRAKNFSTFCKICQNFWKIQFFAENCHLFDYQMRKWRVSEWQRCVRVFRWQGVC